MVRKRDIREKASGRTELRQLTDFEEYLLKETRRKVTVRVDGEMQEIDLAQAVISKHVQVAVGGSPHALGQVSRSIIETQILNQARIREDVERGKGIKKKLESLLERAVRNGAEPNWVAPHPDYIVIVEGEGWSVCGPVDEEGLKPIRERVEMRDVLLLQSVLDERLGARTIDDEADFPMPEQAGSTSTVFAVTLNESLPTRFQLSSTQMVFRRDRFHRMTKRQLLTKTFQAWATIGQPRPRGTTLPPWRDVEPQMNRLVAVSRLVLGEISNGEIKSGYEIADRLREYWPAESPISDEIL